jgi:hypothetical protein
MKDGPGGQRLYMLCSSSKLQKLGASQNFTKHLLIVSSSSVRVGCPQQDRSGIPTKAPAVHKRMKYRGIRAKNVQLIRDLKDINDEIKEE